MIDNGTELLERPRTKKAMKSTLSDRQFETYVKELQLDIADLGKKVLDLGSGETEHFARQAAQYGIEVVSVNPQLADEQVRKARLKALRHEMNDPHLPDQKRSVAAFAQQLPFQDEAFDSVVSQYAVPLWVNKEDYPAAFKEVQRVLRPNGKAYLGPVGGEEVDRSIAAMDELGMQYELQETPFSKQFKPEDSEPEEREYNIVITKSSAH